MEQEPRARASSAYALGQLQRALEAARRAGDAEARDRALGKADRWETVLAGMADGTLTVGSRTPVADTPAWVTLEVAHGGFATGRFLAEEPLRDEEAAVAASLPGNVTGTTERERLNLWYLGDEGLNQLRMAVAEQRYRIDVPEEGALLVVAWLLHHHHWEAALDLVSALRPLMYRLRFTPRFETVPRPAGATVRRETAAAVAAALRSRGPQPQVAAMRETLTAWHPLFDRLVELWAETVDGEPPRLSVEDGGATRVVGGWPCQRWPADWAERRHGWLSDYRSAVRQHRLSRRHLHPKGNFARLRSALERCENSRALEAPIDELVQLGVVPSGEVLAEVLPQISGQVLAAAIAGEQLSALYAQVYGAFRRRRSLLLLNLEHQIRFEELPWIAALEPWRSAGADVERGARQTLERATVIAFSAFPHQILPNPLVREFAAIAGRAGLRLALVDEVAADIFMGTFAETWRHAAAVASRVLDGTLYARYYDLPPAESWKTRRPLERVTRRWGKPTAEDFAAVCTSRSLETHTSSEASYIAANGAVLEQSQILTTHNLAVLVDGLGLTARLPAHAPELAERALAWAVRRQQQLPAHPNGQLRAIRQAAYAWRQAIFFLSFCAGDEQLASLSRLRELVASGPAGVAARFRPAVDGLQSILEGHRFDRSGMAQSPSTGRRFLGWSVGPHWALPAQPVAARR